MTRLDFEVKTRFMMLFFLVIILAGCSSTVKTPLVEGKTAIADKAMVVSVHPEASRAGASILRQGGNAIDAAVATEFALAVCYPEAGNIGGGGFMVIRKNDGTAEVIDYREKAPAAASRNMFLATDGEVINGSSTSTRLASGVPGTVDGVIKAHSKYGKIPFEKVIKPAIELAEKGFILSKRQAASLNANRDAFIGRNNHPTAFVKDQPWKEGDTLRQPELAETLRRISAEGRNGFYAGITAEMITVEMQNGGGLISKEDLAGYHAVERKPLFCTYRDYRVITVPPPSSGGIILTQLLKMVEPYKLGEMGFHSSAAMHLIIEAERRSFADRAEYLGDPDFMTTDPARLTDSSYIAGRMSSFDPLKASLSSDIKPGLGPAKESTETTHYSVVDAEGNAVSATTTLNGTFGSSIVVAGAGFLLNNEMDDFSVKPGFPNMYGLVGGEANSVQPGKRMLSSMTPVIIEKDGRLLMVAGSPGGSTIPTTVFQVVVNVLDFGMDIGNAVNAGRFHHQWLPDVVNIEKGAADSLTIAGLRLMGYNFSERSVIGSVNAITIHDDGKREGAADIRGNNLACGF